MRRPKFKIWDTQENKWFKPTYRAYAGELEDLLISPSGDLIMLTLNHLHENVISHESMFPDRFITVEYTGLIDRNGKELYEGDIVHVKHPSGHDEIKFITHTLDKRYHREEGKTFLSTFCYTDKDGYHDAFCWINRPYEFAEVIGNIYENPELLEVS